MKIFTRFSSAIVVIAALSLTGCASLVQQTEPPHISITNLKILDIQLLEQQYGLTMRIQNPNDFPLSIKGLSYKLEINGSKLAYGVSNSPITVPAFGEKKLDVTMVSGTFGIIRQLQSLEQQGRELIDYRLSGKLSLTNRLLPIYFEKTGSLDLNTNRK